MKYLFTPGPVPLPHEVANSGARPMIGHRSEEFSALLLRLQNRLRDLLKSSGPVVLFPSSGTGALQSLVENLLRPGDVVISVSCGQFGFRFREMASRMDCQIVPVDVPWGGAVAPEAVVEAVKAHPEARAILLTHNETSTGVINPIHAIASALPKERPLLLVDVVSSLGVAPCLPEAWGVDALAGASQKGLLCPPGVGVVWLSPRAWEALESLGHPKSFYFDLLGYKDSMERLQSPYTPPISLFYSLDAALSLLAERGYAKWWKERRRFAAAFAAGVEAMGLDLLVSQKRHRSPGVTAIKTPEAKRLKDVLYGMGVEVAGGLGALNGQIVRVAHYTDMAWPEMCLILGSIYGAAKSTGLSVNASFLDAAQRVWEEDVPCGKC